MGRRRRCRPASAGSSSRWCRTRTPSFTAISRKGPGPRAAAAAPPESLTLAWRGRGGGRALLGGGASTAAARHWTDRGEGYQPPLGDNVLKLHAGAPFAVLAKPD